MSLRRIGISLSGTREYIPGRFRHPASGDTNTSMYVVSFDRMSLFSTALKSKSQSCFSARSCRVAYSSTAHPGIMSLKYIVSIPDPTKREIHVRLSIKSATDGLTLRLPAWIPGSYMIRDFSRHIVEMGATDSAGRHLQIQKIDKHSWRITADEELISIDYVVYANDLSVRGAHVDNTHAFFNGAALYLSIDGFQHLPHQVTILQPDAERYANWQVATTMPIVSVDDHCFGEYEAQDYERLIDYPVEISAFCSTPVPRILL